MEGGDSGNSAQPNYLRLALMIDQIVSHYGIVEQLGGGGIGVVYKAEGPQAAPFCDFRRGSMAS